MMNGDLYEWYLKGSAEKAAEVTNDIIKEGNVKPEQALMLTLSAALIELDKTLEKHTRYP